LSFLDPQGWRYCLPAFMRWSLLHVGQPGSDLVDDTIYTLSGRSPLSRERLALLSGDQLLAVCAFLQLMAAHPEDVDAQAAEEALKNIRDTLLRPT
jgi:hypothetical protein